MAGAVKSVPRPRKSRRGEALLANRVRESPETARGTGTPGAPELSISLRPCALAASLSCSAGCSRRWAACTGKGCWSSRPGRARAAGRRNLTGQGPLVVPTWQGMAAASHVGGFAPKPPADGPTRCATRSRCATWTSPVVGIDSGSSRQRRARGRLRRSHDNACRWRVAAREGAHRQPPAGEAWTRPRAWSSESSRYARSSIPKYAASLSGTP